VILRKKYIIISAMSCIALLVDSQLSIWIGRIQIKPLSQSLDPPLLTIYVICNVAGESSAECSVCGRNSLTSLQFDVVHQQYGFETDSP